MKIFQKRFYIFILLFLPLTQSMASHKVYFVHGLWGFSAEYIKIRHTLKKERFQTEMFSYNSVGKPLTQSAERLMNKIKNDKSDTISIVCHSMGGLVVRSMLQQAEFIPDFPTIYRIVMIAPPNKGAISANSLYEKKFYRFIMGVNLKHICTFPTSLSQTLPVPKNIEIGIIAGNVKNNYDGEIKVEETKLGVEKDFAIVKSHHILILQKKATINYTLNFLKNGKF